MSVCTQQACPKAHTLAYASKSIATAVYIKCFKISRNVFVYMT